MAVFTSLSELDYPSISMISINEDYNIKYSDYSFTCNHEKINTELLKSCKLLPYETVLKLMEGSLCYISNLARIKNKVNKFSERDLEIIKDFKKFVTNSTIEAYNSAEKYLSFKNSFPSLEASFNNIDISVRNGNLKVGNKVIKDACYMINNIDNLMALICWCLYDSKLEINVLKLKDLIPSTFITLCSKAISEMKSVSKSELVYIPATEDSMNSFLDTCSINEQSKIVDSLFGIEVERVKVK